MAFVVYAGFEQGFLRKKLASASQTKVTTSSARGEIYDASGKPLVENTLKQVVSFTRSNKMTAKDLKEIASQLLGYVSISSPNLTDASWLITIWLILKSIKNSGGSPK